jgi:hypothetical protein
MGNIVIPEAALDEFLKLVLARVTKEGEGLAAESRARCNADEAMFRARLNADEAMLRAQLNVALERGLRDINEIKRKMRAAEEEIERKRAAVDEELERKRAAADEEIERKMRAVDEEIERKRRAAEAVEQGPAVSAPPYRAAPERGQNGGTDGPGSLAGSVDQDDLGLGPKGGIR